MLPVAVLIALLAPPQFLRSEPPVSDNPAVTLTALAYAQPSQWPAGLGLTGVWEIAGNDWRLGGWSALAPLAGGKLAAFSDRGMRTTLDPDGSTGTVDRVQLPSIPVERRDIVDIESAVFDQTSGTLWLGLEYHNAVVRYEQAGGVWFRQPAEMKPWPINAGPEAMTRLADGRFIILSEAGGGLLFEGDPVEKGQAVFSFSFDLPGGFQPTDAAALPDGSMLVLLRRLVFDLPPFDAMIVHAFPAQLEAGGSLEYRRLANLVPALPSDNYEGLAITPAAGGTYDIWVASDDNQAAMQRSLLARINWNPQIGSNEAGRP